MALLSSNSAAQGLPPPPPSESPPELPPPVPAAEAPPADSTILNTDPKLQLDHANHYYSREDYRRAIPEYLKFIDLFPNHPQVSEAQYRLAESYREVQNKPKAEELFVHIIKRYPNTEFEKRAVYRLGEMRYVEGRYAEAIEVLTPLLSQKTSAAVRNGAAYYAAKSYAEQAKWAEAEKVLAPVAKTKDLRELGPYIHELMGRIEKAQGRAKEALAAWQQALKLNPPDTMKPDLLVLAGGAQLELGDAKGALATFTALQKEKLPEQYVPAATVGYIRSAYEAAEYKRITELATVLYGRLPEEYRAEAGFLIGSANRKLFYWEPAVQWFEKNLAEFPDSRYAQFSNYDLLLCYAAVNKEDKLQAAAARFLGKYPDASTALNVHFMLAESLFKERKFREALPHYDVVAQKGQGEELKADAAYKRAWCLQIQGEKEKAEKEFLAFVAEHPKNANADDALYLAAVLAADQKHWADAAKHFGELESKFPSHPFNSALFERAMAQWHLKDHAGMEKSLKSFLDAYPKHARSFEAAYWLGWIETQRKNWEAALKYFDAAAKKTDSSFYDEVRMRRSIVYYYLNRVDDAQREIQYFAGRRRLKEIPLEVIRWTAQKRLETFKYAEAIEAYRWYLETAQTKPQVTDAQMGLAKANAGKGNWTEAVQAYRKVIAGEGLNDLGMEARLGAARAILEKGSDIDPAQKLVNEVMTERPEGLFNARARMLQGDILVVQKKDKEAGAEYYSVGLLFDDPELSPWALKLAADSFERAGDLAEARRVRDELAKKYPNASAQNGRP